MEFLPKIDVIYLTLKTGDQIILFCYRPCRPYYGLHKAAPQIRVRLTPTTSQIEHTVTFSKSLVSLSLAMMSSIEKGIDMI